MTVSDVFDPAIRYAERGIPVGVTTATNWKINEKKLRGMPGGRTFLRDGKTPRAGEIIRNVALANLFKVNGTANLPSGQQTSHCN